MFLKKNFIIYGLEGSNYASLVVYMKIATVALQNKGS